MRHIGTLPNESDAQRFAAYLATEGTSAHAEQENDGWAIWVRDENQVEQARAAFEDFRHHPERPAYRGVEQAAENLRREEAQKREAARKNIVEMRGRWGRSGGARRRRPLTMTIIGLCVFIGLTSNMGRDTSGPVLSALLFCDPSHKTDPAWSNQSVADRFVDVRQGQIWRLITPIFVHYDAFHLAFNMFMLYQLGSLIEDRRGTTRFGLMVIVMGLASSVAEPIFPSDWGGTAFAAGMSGVIFGLFGYAWMKTVHEPQLGILIARSSVIILMVWLFLGFSGALSVAGVNIANWAHGFGLVSGVIIGYAPVLLRGPNG